MKKTIVHFIRHGQTMYNLERRIQGSSDIDLSTKGKIQANSISYDKFLDSYDIAFHSSLSRSKETLDIIMEGSLSDRNIPIELSDLIIERSYGCLEGLTEEEINTKYPIKYLEWKNNENTKIEYAETIENVVLRVRDFIKFVVENKYENILAITHSGYLFALYKFITNTDLGKRPSHISFPNCSSVYLNIFHIGNTIVKLELQIEDKTYINSSSPTEMIVSTA